MSPFLVVAALLQEETPDRTPSIYRCPAIEAESKFFPRMIANEGFDTYCVDPKPGAGAIAAAKGKVKFIHASEIDTKPNLEWRNAAIAFVNGKISPRAFLTRIANLKETVHFLSSPKTEPLRKATWKTTGQLSSKAVFAEMLLLSWPGKPCLTADDTGQTRYLPGPGQLESWLLAMRDYLGPMLYCRHSEPYVVTGKPKIIRADTKPGLLIFSQSSQKKTLTFYLNNGPDLMPLPAFEMDEMTINLGLDVEGEKPRLRTGGFMIVATESPPKGS